MLILWCVMADYCFAGEMPAIPACDHRRTAKKLAEAGCWPEAVQLAQEKGTLDDALLLRAIDGLADQVRCANLNPIKLGTCLLIYLPTVSLQQIYP